MSAEERQRIRAELHLDGEFATCMGDDLIGSWWEDFVLAMTKCVNAAPTNGNVKDGYSILSARTSSEMALLALLLALASLAVNIALCFFVCARRDYQELGEEEPDGPDMSDTSEPATPKKAYTVQPEDFANFLAPSVPAVPTL
mmetsp:Transcript_58933/g.140673  ORF Transcript_58933/g.140673 Transcript_58933/m.140673 type:complete len:143 (-) Transcript_58933:124-552(-)|eukprot:CAMPEP_0178382802 /NCGR_PEP_ID=MMETSP0689_2-20121128/6677_1 /TAXON_ID=160604 /ORGANISM="Amphidinium massartii, Strain CS-259" /LENGTH=142 /DNA_ID=CAMNT_0020003009 /DNA_START=46 /DNA_END=474 /DNA_ORIENTATION=+